MIYWLTPIVAWLTAQLLKVVVAAVKGERKLHLTFLSSGNMPSSHSAITVATLIVIAAIEGIDSSSFGVMFVVTSIVIYDALNVRRAVGEQGSVLSGLTDRKFYTALGHRPSEVVAGVLVGVGVALVMLQILLQISPANLLTLWR